MSVAMAVAFAPRRHASWVRVLRSRHGMQWRFFAQSSGQDATNAICLYQSRADVGSLAKEAYKKCCISAGLGALGFTGVAAGVGPTAPMPALALVALGSFANTYKQLVLSRNTFGVAAARHVERLQLLPDGNSPPPASKEELAAVRSLIVDVRTSTFDLTLRLEEPGGTLEGSKTGRYAGLHADSRMPFQDACKAAQLLYLDPPSGWGKPGSPTCDHPEMLAYLTTESPKVIAEVVRFERRDVINLLQRSPDEESIVKAFTATGAGSGAPLAAFGSMPVVGSTSDEFEKMGKQSLFGGFIFFAAGAIFTSRLVLRQQTGETGRDPSVRDVLPQQPGR